MDANRLEFLQQQVEASQSLVERMIEQVGTFSCELMAMREELAALSEAVLSLGDEEPAEAVAEVETEVEPEPAVSDEPAETMTVGERFGQNRLSENLNERFENRFRASLSRSMSLNDRFRFQRELFHGSQTELSEALTAIEQCTTFDEAWDLVCHKLSDIDTIDSEALQEFRSLVELHFS